ncbi:MAG: hypothetical protein HY852_07710 [Bradyrhizobium sp.]|uniref:hypothetical protein n=1 Tax=Bradyrhizobium sp. TaxID=376 RepID=UPI0025C5EC1A|nr:hypothetical protein [Bradyrhizobium sp.]MBI5261688.1 hypothetical protein [Bradyrhizobium sp.]
MRSLLLLFLVTLLVPSAAQPLSKAAVDDTPVKRLAPKSAPAANSCAAFGPGFVKVDGSDTCVKIGGAIGIGVGAAGGGRR